jgi:broad specificity phosphatase PhoE
MRVCPLVSEVVVFGCDVSSYIGEPIAGFESFDWSEMSGGNGQDYWLYPRMDPTIRNTLDMTDIRTSLSANIEANGFQKVETDESVAKRISEFKQKVAGRNDVAVVTHYAFINRYFNDYKAQNCEFVEVPN